MYPTQLMGYINMILLLHCLHWHNFTVPGDLSRQINLLFITGTSPKTLKHFSRQFIPQDCLNPSPQNSHLALSPILNYYILIFTRS